MTIRDQYPHIADMADMLRESLPGARFTYIRDIATGDEWGSPDEYEWHPIRVFDPLGWDKVRADPSLGVKCFTSTKKK